MIKLKDLLKESYAWERKFGEKLPTLASVQKKKLKEEINKLTEKLSKSDIKKMRDKFNKTGKLPPHLKKLADLMDKHKEVEDIVVPGLEWMNDIPEGVVKKETQQLNEGPAYEYANAFSKFEKAYMQLRKATDDLGRFVTKKTGEKVDQKIFEKQWKKQVAPFYELMKSWVRGKL